MGLLSRERSFSLFATGQRIGDLRRRIRQCDRTEEQLFPSGASFEGGECSNGVTLPVEEPNDPDFHQRLDREA